MAENWSSPEFATHVAHPARMYDYYLGGTTSPRWDEKVVIMGLVGAPHQSHDHRRLPSYVPTATPGWSTNGPQGLPFPGKPGLAGITAPLDWRGLLRPGRLPALPRAPRG